MVPRTRFELATSPLPRECSTPEPPGLYIFLLNWETGAGEGNRTLIISLEGFCITTMLLPHEPQILFWHDSNILFIFLQEFF